ncbi:hypothetical protein L208DRAFT_1417353 [Tricholoma matsutake]|nr:hypothetical protein L208DRAFT_1417353 [Tricholoma matsutake 945]
MPSASYERLPTEPKDDELENGRRRHDPPPTTDPRFNPPTPSPYTRAALLIFIAFLFWLAFILRKAVWVGVLTA